MPQGDLPVEVLGQYFRDAVGLDPTALATFLDNLPDSGRLEVQLLLEADHDAESFFDLAVARELSCIGSRERFGPFETVAFLGAGGMGAVFVAERVDGEVEQTVAIKVVERGWTDLRAVERFRQERQFLAGLSHPNIAGLIDGGTRSDGVAYLVMEYVDGQRIDRYCDDLALSVRDRLRLFIPLCDAVDYAHRRLIVHRDLKPSNVMVGRDGRPMLLDFGVAKALEDPFGGGRSHATQTIALTPEFASPEQVRGEEITTATDVYGLGSLLYCLLTGRAPHQITGTSRSELERAICESEPVRPGSIRPDLKGDLDNILLKALHREPGRRYFSAHALAEDIERYLDRRPVLATRDSIWYLLRRFVQRNQAASIAAVLALIAMIAGAGVSLYQERRAQARFNQVRELANKFIFEFEASIRDTPGTLSARREMAKTARQYLSSLEADAGHDPGLLRELAESHYRLSVVESEAQEYDAWLADLKKAAAILRELKADCCGPLAQRILYVNVLNDMVHYWVDRTPSEAMQPAAESLRAAQAIQKEWPDDVVAARTAVEAAMIEGIAFANIKKIQESLRYMKEAVRLSDEARSKFPQDAELAGQRAAVGNRYANLLTLSGEYDRALEEINRAVAVLDPLMLSHPENNHWRKDRIKLATGQANLLRRAARTNPALRPQVTPAFRSAYLMARDNAVQNPGNHDALDLSFVMTSRYAGQLSQEGRDKEALSMFQEAAATLDVLERSEPFDHRSRLLRAENMASQGRILVDLRRWTEGDSELQKANEMLGQIIARWPGDVKALDEQVSLLANRMTVEEHFGKIEEARKSCTQALQIAQRIIELDPQEDNPVYSMKELREQARRLGLADAALLRAHQLR